MFFVLLPISELLRNVNTDNIFYEIHDRSSLQQARITELAETMSSSSCERTTNNSRLDHNSTVD